MKLLFQRRSAGPSSGVKSAALATICAVLMALLGNSNPCCAQNVQKKEFTALLKDFTTLSNTVGSNAQLLSQTSANLATFDAQVKGLSDGLTGTNGWINRISIKLADLNAQLKSLSTSLNVTDAGVLNQITNRLVEIGTEIKNLTTQLNTVVFDFKKNETAQKTSNSQFLTGLAQIGLKVTDLSERIDALEKVQPPSTGLPPRQGGTEKRSWFWISPPYLLMSAILFWVWRLRKEQAILRTTVADAVERLNTRQEDASNKTDTPNPPQPQPPPPVPKSQEPPARQVEKIPASEPPPTPKQAAPAPPVVPAKSASKEPPARTHTISPREWLGVCYTEFCHVKDSEFRQDDFYVTLKKKSDSIKIEKCYRLTGANKSNLYFTSQIEGSSQKYWRVCIGTDHYLLPIPMSNSRFGGVQGFTIGGAGSIGPGSMQNCVPALLSGSDDRWEVESFGVLDLQHGPEKPASWKALPFAEPGSEAREEIAPSTESAAGQIENPPQTGVASGDTPEPENPATMAANETSKSTENPTPALSIPGASVAPAESNEKPGDNIEPAVPLPTLIGQFYVELCRNLPQPATRGNFQELLKSRGIEAELSLALEISPGSSSGFVKDDVQPSSAPYWLVVAHSPEKCFLLLPRILTRGEFSRPIIFFNKAFRTSEYPPSRPANLQRVQPCQLNFIVGFKSSYTIREKGELVFNSK